MPPEDYFKLLLATNPSAYWPLSDDAGARAEGLVVAAATENLLSYGTFEVDGSTETFAGWRDRAGTGTIAKEGTLIHGGAAAVKLTRGSDDNLWIYQDLKVVPGDSLSLTLWARGDATVGGRFALYDLINRAYIIPFTATGVTGATYAQVDGTSAPADLVLNGDFESYASGPNWTFWVNRVSDGALANETDLVHGGDNAVKLTAGASVDTWVYQDVPCAANQEYTLNVWAQGDGTYSGRYAIYDSINGAWIATLTTLGATEADYTAVPITFTTPPGCTEFRLYLACPATYEGIAYVDDVTILADPAYTAPTVPAGCTLARLFLAGPTAAGSVYFDDVVLTALGTLHGSYSPTGVTLGQPGIGDGRTAPSFTGTASSILIGGKRFDAIWNGDLGSAIAWGKMNATQWADTGEHRYLFHPKSAADPNFYVVFGKKNVASTLFWMRKTGVGKDNNEQSYAFDTPPTTWFCMGYVWDRATPSLRGYLYVPGVLDFTEVFDVEGSDLELWGTNPVDDYNTVLMAGSTDAQEFAGLGAHVCYWGGRALTITEMQAAMTLPPVAVAAASTKTLNHLRDRVRVQLESATGLTEPLVVTASSIHLTTGTVNMRDRVESRLQDATNVRWSTDDTDEAIRTALAYYSRQNPAHAIGTITLTGAGREISLASLTGLIRVEKVWWDYDPTSPGYPPNWRQFEVWPGAILYIDDRAEPAPTDVLRVWYTKLQTLNGLDSATATTIPAEDVDVIVTGAAHYAARARAVELAEQATVDDDVVARLIKWADEEGDSFRYGVRQKPPAWQRYAYAYDQGDIDEAIRWAIYRYTEVLPQHTIGTVTLTATGREIDISSLTGYIDVLRVAWPYTAGLPGPWREFDLWPDDLIYLHTGDEPTVGDVVRIFYTTSHTLDGLDNATTTTLPERDINLIVTGATAFAAEERVQEQPTRNIPRKLREWAESRLREFEQGLRRLARRQAAKHSGIAPMPDLDRWDTDRGGW